MSPARRGASNDVADIARRVATQLSYDAAREPLISAHFSRSDFELALGRAIASVWVDESHGRIRGHLYGSNFVDSLHGRQTWTGPDGYSANVPDILDRLCERAYDEWRSQGTRAHLVWATAHDGFRSWLARGYEVVGVRGALALAAPYDVTWPAHARVRRGAPRDLATALAFDRQIDAAQGVDLANLTREQREASEADLVELLEDPECHYYLLEVDDRAVAQCITFPLPLLRGNFEDTIYVGSLAVSPDAQRGGLGTALVHHVLNEARADGFAYAEARWHADNEPATSFWARVDFRPTYLQLRRRLVD